MASFPQLKSKVVAQYPSRRTVAFRNVAVRFLDGQEQWYRDQDGPLRTWEIRLEQIDEAEAAALEQFFLGRQGAFGSFEFTDPSDGEVYPDCSFAIDEAEFATLGEMRLSTRLVIRENP